MKRNKLGIVFMTRRRIVPHINLLEIDSGGPMGMDRYDSHKNHTLDPILIYLENQGEGNNTAMYIPYAHRTDQARDQ